MFADFDSALLLASALLSHKASLAIFVASEFAREALRRPLEHGGLVIPWRPSTMFKF